MKNASDYFFLEHVPSGHPMDVAYIDRAHMMAYHRPEFGITDPGSMVLIYHENGYDLLLEKEKWTEAAKKILNYLIATDERVDTCTKKLSNLIEFTRGYNQAFKVMDYGYFADEALCLQLDTIINFETAYGIQMADISGPNYGTNLIHIELQKVVKDLGFAPHTIVPMLLSSTKVFPIGEYEKEIGNLALKIFKESGNTSLNEETISITSYIKEAIDSILDKYGWLDAGLSNPPKSLKNVVQDINDLLSFGNELDRIIEERETAKVSKKEERLRVVEAVYAKANAEQKRLLNFAIDTAELGRIFVDEVMEWIFHRRRIYAEFAKRLGVSETEVKYLLAPELKEHLSKKIPVDVEEIKNRQKLFVLFLEHGEITSYTGDEAQEWKKKFAPIIADSERPLKGDIAFSKGKVRGIARPIRDASEMDKVGKGDILISSRTYPDLLPAMKRSAAIIAELGGLLSHAAIVSRELHIPCVVGVRNAMSKIKDGDEIEVDTETGAITILNSK